MSEKLLSIADLNSEIARFEKEMALRKAGKLDEKVFAEIRLRRGVYGQRYDNGQRHDGEKTQTLQYESGDRFKGPDTLWDAPGMQRIKIPFGGLTPAQLETIADLAEAYSDGIAHVTTRQDFQLHYVHIEDTPSIMRRLAQVGITTREACGNSVRNVTACPIAGVCSDESFDVTPYALALAKFLLGHPDVQDFGRKFKIAFSGCRHQACGLTSMHDMGAIAVTRDVAGRRQRGFELYVGGGLGAVPHTAKLFDDFIPEEELLPLTQAIARVFTRLGEKKNRAKARIKFLVQNLGIAEFKRLVLEERKQLPHDRRWTELITAARAYTEKPLKPAGRLEEQTTEGFDAWYKTNVYKQRQQGYVTVTIKLLLGDITSHQLRQLADIARTYIAGTVRTTVEQNIVLRWVSETDLHDLYKTLKKVRLAADGACGIEDIVACPGTDTCKLGIASSRGLAAELQRQITDGLFTNGNGDASRQNEIDAIIRNLRIKISGCFNSCGQHHIADLGFYGISRKAGSHTVPHFQVVLGGQWQENAGAFGLAIGAIPSKKVPEFVSDIVNKYRNERLADESFQTFFKRVGKLKIKQMLQQYGTIPQYSDDASFYSDWGDPREFTIGDMGVGECAGEVVSPTEFELSSAERQVFEAQIALEKGDLELAGKSSYQAMLRAARGLIVLSSPFFPEEADKIVQEFRTRFFDTQIFFDKYAGGKFGKYLFAAHAKAGTIADDEYAHRQIEEAQLFIEAAYSCYLRMHDAGNGGKAVLNSERKI
jgi:sulfite reductase (ferredoxin)